MSEEGSIRRIPPHSESAEQSVIGSMLISKEAIMAVSEILNETDFYDRRCGAVFSIITELEREGKPVDLVMIENQIKILDLTGIIDMEFIGEIISAVPTSVNAVKYAEIVYKNSMLRKLIKVAEEISYKCYMPENSLDDVLGEAEKKVFELVQRKDVSRVTDIKEILISVIEDIEAAAMVGGTVTGIPTGFYDLDYKMAGLHNSDLILIAARPSMGKTAFALNIAEYVTTKQQVTTAIFSLEMSKEQLVKRILSMNSRVDSHKLRTGQLGNNDWRDIIDSARIIGETNLIIDDTPGISVAELRSKCRKLKVERGLGLVLIDYIQLMSGNKHSESRQQEISEISRALKSLARELDAPIIALSQLSRRVEQRDDKRPMLSDLRESGAIEQDADVVMFLYRDEYYHKDSSEAGISEVIIGKQRNGPVGTIKLGWQSEFTKFVNLAKENS